MKHFTLIFSLLALLFSTGCAKNNSISQNYRAIEQLKLVHTIGLDAHREGVSLSICAGESDSDSLLRLHSTGSTISEAVSRLQKFAGKEELYYAHTRYVLVGEDYAKEGLENLLQYLESSSQLRTDLPLFIVKGDTAKALVLEGGGKDSSIFQQLDAVLRDCTQQGNGYPYSCGDIGCFSAEYGSTLACALTPEKEKNADPTADEETLTPVTAGYGVLKHGKLVGYISHTAAPGVNFLLGQTGTEPMTVTVRSQPTALRITKASTTLTPTFGSEGTLRSLTIGLQLEATLEESTDGKQGDLNKLGESFAKTVKTWVDEILQIMRKTESDFLGFLPQIAMEFPHAFARTPIDWRSGLKTLPLQAEVTCTVISKE